MKVNLALFKFFFAQTVIQKEINKEINKDSN